jgi:hypothetical protein
MISKAFHLWIKENQLNTNMKWTDFLTTLQYDKPKIGYDINASMEAWYKLTSAPADIEAYFETNPDAGMILVDQTGEMVVAHHPGFASGGNIYAYTTNQMQDNPIELVLNPDILKPLMPTFNITWNKKVPPPTQTNVLYKAGHTIGDDNTIEDTDDDNIPIADLAAKTKKPKKKRQIHRTRKQHLDINKNTINSIILIPTTVLAKLLTLSQPFQLNDIKVALDDLYLDLMTHPDYEEFENGNQLSSLILTFKECADHGNFHFLSQINQIRNPHMVHKAVTLCLHGSTENYATVDDFDHVHPSQQPREREQELQYTVPTITQTSPTIEQTEPNLFDMPSKFIIPPPTQLDSHIHVQSQDTMLDPHIQVPSQEHPDSHIHVHSPDKSEYADTPIHTPPPERLSTVKNRVDGTMAAPSHEPIILPVSNDAKPIRKVSYGPAQHHTPPNAKYTAMVPPLTPIPGYTHRPSAPSPFINSSTNTSNTGNAQGTTDSNTMNTDPHQLLDGTVPTPSVNMDWSQIPTQPLTEEQQMAWMRSMTQSIVAIHMHTIKNPPRPTDTLERILEKTAQQDKAPSARTKRYDALPSNMQRLIRRMQVVDIYDIEPAEPSDTYLDLINSSNKFQQIGYVNSVLKSKKVLGRWGSGHISRFIFIGPLWMDQDEPFGLTMLGINCTGKPDLASDKNLQLTLQQGMVDKLSPDDVAMLIKRELYIPQSVHEIRTIFTTYEAVLSIICTPSGIIPQMMRGWITHFDNWFPSYNTLFRERDTFGTRLIYAIDLSLQMFLEQLMDEEREIHEVSRFHLEDEMRIYQEQIQRRQFDTSLPTCLMDLKRKRKADSPPDNIPNQNRPDNHQAAVPRVVRANNNKSPPVANKNPNPKWKLPATKQFHDCFYAGDKRSNRVPKHDNIDFCIRFLVLGECANGLKCRFSHKDPRDVAMESQFDEFCRIAYS